MVQALNQFLCGIPLKTGTYFILTLNLIINVGLILVSYFNVIKPMPMVKLNMLTELIIALGFFGLMGMPFILSGFWGCYMRSEPHIRMYLFYTWIMFIALLVGPAIFVAASNPCQILIPKELRNAKGSAQACGSLMTSLYGCTALFAAVMLYLIFTVWSFAQELSIGGGKYGLPVLVTGRERKKARGVASGLFGTGAQTLQPSLPVNYASCATMGIGGNGGFFNSKGFHDTNFPPVGAT